MATTTGWDGVRGAGGLAVDQGDESGGWRWGEMNLAKLPSLMRLSLFAVLNDCLQSHRAHLASYTIRG